VSGRAEILHPYPTQFSLETESTDLQFCDVMGQDSKRDWKCLATSAATPCGVPG